MRKKLVVAGSFMLAMVVVACQQGGSPTAPVSENQGASFQSVSASAQVKAEICHLDDDDSFKVINVADPSLESHLAHGDHIVVAEVCGDSVDNDCDGQVDEECTAATCPCESSETSISSLGLGSLDLCTVSGDVVTFSSTRLFGTEATSSVAVGATQCTWKASGVTVASDSGYSQEAAQDCHEVIIQYADSQGVTCL